MKKNVRVLLTVVLALMLTVSVAVTAFATAQTDITEIDAEDNAELFDLVSAAVKEGATNIQVNVSGTLNYETYASYDSDNLTNLGDVLESLTIVGTAEDSKFVQTGIGVEAMGLSSGVLTFRNITIEDTTVYTSENGESAWEFCYAEYTGKLVFENCVIRGEYGGIMTCGDASFVDCEFISEKNGHGGTEYAIWVYNGDASFENCTFTGRRALKAHEDYGSHVMTVTVDNCDFFTVAEKPGIAIGTMDKDAVFTITNCTFFNCQPGDQENYAYESDTDVTTFNFTFDDSNKVCGTHVITEVEANDSTCTATGNIAHYTCKACERLYSDAEGETEITAEDTVVKMKEHTYNEGVQTTAPTCDKTGVKTYTCTATGCGHTKTETIAAAGHKLTKIDAKAPTYTAEGNIEHYLCSVCKKLYADAEAKTELTADKIVIAMLIKVEEEKAEVSEDAVDSAITEAAKNETSTEIVLDLNKVAEDAVEDTTEKPAEVVSVQLPVASLEKVAELHEEATLTVVMNEATVTMDAATLEAVTKQAEGSTVTLVVEQVPVEKLSEKQQEAVKNKEVVATISAEIICDTTGNTIHDFEGGSVTVQIPFAPEEGTKGEDYAVYYVADDGSVEKIATKYVDGHLVVTLEHFSEYVIVNTKANADPSNPGTGDLSMAPVFALLVINAIGAAAIVTGKKRIF